MNYYKYRTGKPCRALLFDEIYFVDPSSLFYVISVWIVMRSIHYSVIKGGSVYRGSPLSLFHKNLFADHSAVTFNRYGTCGITDNGIHIFTSAGDRAGNGTVGNLKD